MYKKHLEAQTLNARAVLKSLLTVKGAIPDRSRTNKLISEIVDLQVTLSAHAIYLLGTIKQESSAVIPNRGYAYP